MKRLGIGYYGGMSALDIADCAKYAEKRGFQSAWMAEGHGGDGFSVLTVCALATKKIKLGTSITSIYVRSAPTIAMAAATVDAVSKGRFILGIGASHKVQVEPDHGIKFEKPFERMKETGELFRALLKNGKSSYDGEIFKIKEFDFWFKPFRPKIPLFFSAVFPKMLEYTGEVADGVILVWVTPQTTKRAIEDLARGAKRAGRDLSDIEISCLLPGSISKEPEVAKNASRLQMSFYAKFPRYRRLWSEAGFEKEADAMKEAALGGESPETIAGLISEKMVDSLTLSGTAEEFKSKIGPYRKAGLTLPIVFPSASGSKDAKSSIQYAMKILSE
ncbi:MAG: LLM class flavin-dependent oxidoreductase [Candidatus Bathyarchaeia archaeon]